jgi:hypothetical protein
VSLEGAYRSAKTTTGLLKVGHWCWEYPGIPWLLARWTEENCFRQLRPAFLKLWGDRVYKWLSDESCYLIYSKHEGVYSRAYFTGLRPSEGTSPFSKVHGMEFACALIDQPEEINEEYFDHMRTRLSAMGFPQQLVLCPNPQVKTHWLSTTFPEDNSRRAEGYYLVKFKMRDNVAGLGEAYIAGRERELRKKPAEYRRALLGERGLPMAGKPVFGELFQRDRHVVKAGASFNPALPLYESLDFGSLHPAVTWTQYPPGRMHVLGGVLGDDMHLEKFAGEVIKIREEWFPDLHPSLLQWTSDPAGSARNPHGSRSAIDILRDFGIAPRVLPDANQPPRQDFAIQQIAEYLERTWYDGTPVFALDPRFLIVDKHGERHEDTVLVDGFELGLVWDDDRTYGDTQYPHVRPWKRDKWFEHPFVTLFYSVLAFSPPDAAELAGVIRNSASERRARAILRTHGGDDANEKDVTTLAREIVTARARQAQERAEARALKLAQIDHDPDDVRRVNPGSYFRSVRGGPTMSRRLSRGGYR